MAETLNKIGFHTGPSGGNSTGLGDWERALDAADIPFFLKAVDSYGPLFEAAGIMKESGVVHVLVFRMSTAGQNDGYDYDVPPYKDPAFANDPEGGAEVHWQKTLDKLPPEFDKERVWLEVVNEVDKNFSDWLGRFAIRIADLALADGYKVTLFGWSSGEPEPYHWEEPGMLDYLRVCAERPTQAAVSLHEYSFNKDNIFDGFPFKVGRFQYLFATCDKHGISRPTVHITEWGWEHANIPGELDAMYDIVAAGDLYAPYTNIKSANIWYLGPGFGDIANKAQKLILPMTDFALNVKFEVDELDPAIPVLPPISGWEQFSDPVDPPIDPVDPGLPEGGEGQLENIVIALSGAETAVRIAAVDADGNVLTQLELNDLSKVETIIVEAILDEEIPPVIPPVVVQPPSPEPGDIIIDLNAHRTAVNFDALVDNDAKKISLRTSNGLGTGSTDENGVDKMLFDHLSQTAVRNLPYDLYHFVNKKDEIEPQIDLFLEIVGLCAELAGYLPEVLYLDFENTSYETHAEIQYCFQYLYDQVRVVYPEYSFMLGCYSSATWWNPRIPAGITWPASLGLLNWQAYYTSASAPAVIPGPDFRPPLMNGFPVVALWQWNSSAGKLMGQTTDPLDINYVMPLDDVPVSTKFKIGDMIMVTANALNVRDTPAGNSLGTQGSGALGTVVGGPVFASSYHRWQVDFDDAPDGWVAENWLMLIPQVTVPTLFGLHASADGGSGASLEADVAEFKELQPTVVKFITNNGPELIAPIVAEMPDDCVYIVRPFLSWGGRPITAQQFYDDTVNDYTRTIDLLLGMGVSEERIWLELHNEPNLTLEGWTFSWGSGTSFAEWGLAVLDLMRPLYPNLKWMYPGLSPGVEIPGLRTEADVFLQDSMALVAACDGLGVHAYWAANDPRSNALAWIDANVALVPDKPIWITEASYKSAASGDLLGNEYYQFWLSLNQRASVYGVTFYVASASDVNFDNEVWVRDGVSRGISVTINNLM